MTAADMMYSILRQMCDPEYKGPEPPTEQDMIDAVALYEVEQRMANAGAAVPGPTTPARCAILALDQAVSDIASLSALLLRVQRYGITTGPFPEDVEPLFVDIDNTLAELEARTK